MTFERVLFKEYEEAHADVIKTFLKVDQSDAIAMKNIIETSCGGQLDLVIDDASHMYHHSKNTFEASFPYLRPGGVYVLEDWAWSFAKDAQQPDHYWAAEPSLVNLLFEFILASSTPNMITDIKIGGGLVWFTKGNAEVPKSGFSLDAHLPLRGRKISLI